jgi:hypothetical protein
VRTITKPSQSANPFVSFAPNAKRQQISITIRPDTRRRLAKPADQSGQTRAGLLLGAAPLLRDGT